jgi:phasin family protein
MSTHHEATATAISGYAETVSRVASIVSNASDRLIKLQTEAGGAAFSDNAQALHAALTVGGGPAALTAWPGLCQSNVVRVLEVTRRWIEIVSQAQNDMARLMGGRFPVTSLGIPLDLGQFTKSVIEGRDAALAGMQAFLATGGVPAVATAAKKR